jgi:hypothetical protein
MQLQTLKTTRSLRQVAVAVIDFKEAVEEAVEEAWASALSRAHKYTSENTCSVWLNDGNCIWTEDNTPYYCECPALTYTEGAVDAIDAIALAGASQGLIQCRHPTVSLPLHCFYVLAYPAQVQATTLSATVKDCPCTDIYTARTSKDVLQMTFPAPLPTTPLR